MAVEFFGALSVASITEVFASQSVRMTDEQFWGSLRPVDRDDQSRNCPDYR